MKKYITLIGCALIQFISHAQISINPSITGKVYEQNQTPVAFANVILYNGFDSIMVKGEVTAEDGSFQLSNIPPASYWVEISYLGFDKYNTELFTLQEGQDLDLDKFILSSSDILMDEIQVIAKRPLIEVQPDKTVFNVDGSINATGNTALELLKKSPGVIVDNNDNIILNGKNGVQIYIDGKPSYLGISDLAAQLNAMQSSEIDAIEIITNPSAKYEAEGNAGIINIRLKKDMSLGTNINFNTGYSYGSRSKYNSSANVNYRTKHNNIFGSYSFNNGEYENWLNLYRIQNNKLYDEKTVTSSDGPYNSARLGADFFLNENSTLGFLINGYINDRNWINKSNTPITDLTSNILQSTLVSSSENDGVRKRLNGNINYKYDNRNGRLWSVDADWGIFRNDTESYQPNSYLSEDGKTITEERNYRYSSPTDIDIYTIKSDYSRPLWKGTLNLGLKLSLVKTKNNYEYYSILDSEDLLDIDRSNNFVFEENINAAYISYTATYGKFTLSTGLRGEQTNSDGILTALKPTNNNRVNRNYFDLFPSAGITFQPNQKHQLRINYSRRIDRPSYQDLNPFEFKLSELSYSRGNPFLTPQYTNSLSLAHTLNYRLTTSISYSHTSDFFANISDSTELSRTFLETINLEFQKVISLNISYPYSINNNWNTYTSVTGYHSQNKADLGMGRTINLKATVASLYHQSTITLPAGFAIEASGWYSSPAIWGAVYKTEANFSIDMGIKKTFNQGRANLKISVTDVFNTAAWRGLQEFAGFYVDASGGWESRQIRLNLSYLFGNDKVTKTRNRKLGLDDEAGRIN